MSRIGKKPIEVPSGVTMTVDGQNVKAKGSKGELSFTVPASVKVEQSDGTISVTLAEDTKQARAMWGLSRTMIANLIEGVTNGFTKTLEIQGVGYRAAMKGKDLQLNLGFSHEVIYKAPEGISLAVAGQKAELVTVTGIDKQTVGQVAAEIRGYRPPEPYAGKGVRYQGEYVFRKEGKKK